MTVKSACTYIALTFLIVSFLLVGYVVQAGIAIVSVRTPDTRVWVPIPVAFAHVAASFLDVQLKMEKDFQEFWRHREEAREVLQQLPGLPDVELVRVDKSNEHVLIFKRDDALFVHAKTATDNVEIRIPISAIERLAQALENPNPSIGELFACLEWQSSGNLLHVTTSEEEIKIALW